MARADGRTDSSQRVIRTTTMTMMIKSIEHSHRKSPFKREEEKAAG
jgi:hypothetical protein